MQVIKSIPVKLDRQPRKVPWHERFWRWLSPPGPKKMGKSDHNALPSRLFGSKPGAYTWEDWHEDAARDYAVRYFLTTTLLRFLTYYWRRVTDAVYWVKCKTLPSYRFHLIDIRNPGPGIEYTHGFRDKPQTMLWACFVLLREYIEKEEPVNPREAWPDEALNEEPLLSQQRTYDEAKALYDWWMVGRVEEEKAEDACYKHYCSRKGMPDEEEARQAWFDSSAHTDAREQEMLLRLVAIRESLWT